MARYIIRNADTGEKIYSGQSKVEAIDILTKTNSVKQYNVFRNGEIVWRGSADSTDKLIELGRSNKPVGRPIGSTKPVNPNLAQHKSLRFTDSRYQEFLDCKKRNGLTNDGFFALAIRLIDKFYTQE